MPVAGAASCVWDSELRARIGGRALRPLRDRGLSPPPPSSSQRRSGSVRRSLSADLLLLPPLALRLGPSATEGQSQARRRRRRLPLPPLASRLAPSPPSSAHRPSTLRTHLRLPSRLCCTVWAGQLPGVAGPWLRRCARKVFVEIAQRNVLAAFTVCPVPSVL